MSIHIIIMVEKNAKKIQENPLEMPEMIEFFLMEDFCICLIVNDV